MLIAHQYPTMLMYGCALGNRALRRDKWWTASQMDRALQEKIITSDLPSPASRMTYCRQSYTDKSWSNESRDSGRATIRELNTKWRSDCFSARSATWVNFLALLELTCILKLVLSAERGRSPWFLNVPCLFNNQCKTAERSGFPKLYQVLKNMLSGLGTQGCPGRFYKTINHGQAFDPSSDVPFDIVRDISIYFDLGSKCWFYLNLFKWVHF